jgi:hypothetical protein
MAFQLVWWVGAIFLFFIFFQFSVSFGLIIAGAYSCEFGATGFVSITFHS